MPEWEEKNTERQWMATGNWLFFIPRLPIWSCSALLFGDYIMQCCVASPPVELCEDAKAAQVKVWNGHRQVRQNGSSLLVRTHLAPLPKNVYGWWPRGCSPAQGPGQLNLLTSTGSFFPASSWKLSHLSGHKRHPVPGPKFSLCDVIPPEKIITFHPRKLMCSFIQCPNLRHYTLAQNSGLYVFFFKLILK